MFFLKWLFPGKHETVIVASSFEGILTFKNKPVVGATVERNVRWKDAAGESEFTFTDGHGHFAFPLKQAVVSLYPFSQFVMSQRIKATYNEQQYLIWAISKRSKTEYGELGYKPQNLRCELTDKRFSIDIEQGLLITSCTWGAMSERRHLAGE